MSQITVFKILVDPDEYEKFIEYKKEKQLIDKEKTKNLQIVPSSKSIHTDEVNSAVKSDQSGGGVFEKSSEDILAEKLFQKISVSLNQQISDTIAQQLRHINKNTFFITSTLLK